MPRVTKYSNKMPRGVMESPSLEVLKQVWMWLLRTWFHGENGGSDALPIGFGDLKGFPPILMIL